MKKIVFVLTIALMGTLMMNAQRPRRPNMDPEQMAARQIERLDKMLSLTEEQKAEISKIYIEEMKSMKENKPANMEKGSTPDRAKERAFASEKKARRDAMHAKIESVLTPEQAAKYAKMKDHERNRKAGHKGDRKGSHRKGHGDVQKKHQNGCEKAPSTESKCCEKKQ